MTKIAHVLIFFSLLLASPSAGAREKVIDSNLKMTALPNLCEAIGIGRGKDCRNDPRIRALGCDDLKPAMIYWGGLKPYVAMAACWNYAKGVQGDMVRMEGCSVPIRVRFVILEKKDKLRLINNKEEFKAMFAPVDGREDALSYVSALTEAYPIYSFPKKRDEKGEYATKDLRPTEVVAKKDGFTVRLFENGRCGCRAPELYEVEYFVSTGGDIKELKRRTIWKGAGGAGVCMD